MAKLAAPLLPDPGDAGGDQDRVGERAHQHHRPDVVAGQPAAQDERVLAADGDDEREAGGEAGQGGGEHATTLGPRPREEKRKNLQDP